MTIIVPLIVTEAFCTIILVGPDPFLAVPTPLLPNLAIENPCVTGASNAIDNVSAGPGEAEAGGTATAVRITGTDQTAPATTLRRLKPLSALLVSFSFKSSDNCAPM
ncbi:hypothetical protein [Arthrobacter sp. RT-1]|uniref:hypothetical protein n=1 Tax=Arthrobacter sp. RT-1 TaxID=2292263 RepID=UPI0011C05035|nr:hypothetical protein [Arthrobacter sp. RT-1]